MLYLLYYIVSSLKTGFASDSACPSLPFQVLPDGPITPTWMQYTFSVTPSLVAWGALLLPPAPGLLTCMGGLCAAGYLDLVQYGYPSWFKGLRFCLTTVALLSLWSTLMCKMMLEEQEEEKKRGN